MARVITVLAGLWLALPASAQSWQANSFDTGALIHGAAFSERSLLALSCTAPSPGGLELIATGDHESLRTDTAYDLVVSFSIDLLDPWGISPDLPAPSLIIDGQSHPLPAMNYSDFYGSWTGWARFDGPGVLELFDATALIVDTGTGTSQSLAVDGLAAAMTAGLSPCLQRWLELGHPLPARLAAHINRNETEAAPPPTPHQAFPVPQMPPPNVITYLTAGCQGSFTGETADIGSADFDRDGIADFVLDWNDLTCQGEIGPRPNCGAANCLIDVFLSSRNYTNPEGLLAIGFTMTTLPDGRPGIITGGTASVCHYEDCTAPWVFDGQGFQR